MKSFVLLTVVGCLSLGGCSYFDKEIQKDPSGPDRMLESPCACLPLDWVNGAFDWSQVL